MSGKPERTEEGAFEYVFEQEVRAAKVTRYFALSDRLHELARRQPGFLHQERKPVSQGERVWKFQTTLRFDTAEHCVNWLDNPERRKLLHEEEREAGFAFLGHANWEGYARWLTRGLAAEPPKWKVNLLVLLTLYPTVMVLTPLLHWAMGEASFPLVMPGEQCTVRGGDVVAPGAAGEPGVCALAGGGIERNERCAGAGVGRGVALRAARNLRMAAERFVVSAIIRPVRACCRNLSAQV